MKGRAYLWSVVVLVCSLAATACTPSRPAQLQIHVGRADALFDATIPIVVSGAVPGRRLHVEASSRDARGAVWRSGADFVPDSEGGLDLSSSAPLSGSYTGRHADGLLWSMTAGPGLSAFIIGAGSTMAVSLAVSQQGRPTVSTSLTLRFRATGVHVTQLTPGANGFVGMMFEPADTRGLVAPVLVFGGSEGGLGPSELIAQALASRGHPALALAYFGAPGLPSSLAGIPLEYFVHAATWLDHQKGVDPKALTVYGGSRGSEAALLLAADFPDVVHAVVAASPSAVVNPSFPTGKSAAWTIRGRPIPHVTRAELGQPRPSDPAAMIPVTRISGRILMICGDHDLLWPSCAYADEILAELPDQRATLARERGAGHLVDFVVPDLPLSSGTLESSEQGPLHYGGSVEADALGRLDGWGKILKFLSPAQSH